MKDIIFKIGLGFVIFFLILSMIYVFYLEYLLIFVYSKGIKKDETPPIKSIDEEEVRVDCIIFDPETDFIAKVQTEERKIELVRKDPYWMNYYYIPTEEDIQEEIRLGEMELMAQLIQAEAGNQDLKGMQLVGDVVLNRVRSPKFPNTVEEVIFQKKQFSCIKDGNFAKAAWTVSDKAFLASQMEYESEMDTGVLYFSSTANPVNGRKGFKYGAHWFSY